VLFKLPSATKKKINNNNNNNKNNKNYVKKQQSCNSNAFPIQTVHTKGNCNRETEVVKCDESYLILIQTDESLRTPCKNQVNIH
jgi:hypothetical protein